MRRLQRHFSTTLRCAYTQAHQRTGEAWIPSTGGQGVQEQPSCYAVVHSRLFAAAKHGKRPPAAAAAAGAEEEQAVDLGAATKAMDKSIERLQDILASVRVGRASPGMLDHLKVDAYGEKMSLKSLGSVSVRDSQLLAVSAFNPETLPALAKAISDSALHLNPRIEGQEVLVPVPRPNPDTIKAMAKMIKQEGEATKVAIRLARKAVMEQVKKLSSKDVQRQQEKQVQKMTDDFIKDVTTMCEAKEEELKGVA